MDKHDKLFAEWRSLRPEYEFFSNDGILIEDDWNHSPRKIAFILKEPNDGFCEIRGKSHGPKGNSKVFWRNLRIWRYIVHSRLNNSSPTLQQARKEKELPLSDVAYINIKKYDEGRNTSDPKDIQHYADRDWHLLERQIENINPEIIFFCGTYDFLKSKMALSRMTERVFESNNRIVIRFFHPSCRKSYRYTFEELDQALLKYQNQAN